MNVENLKTALVPLMGAKDEISTIETYVNQLESMSSLGELSEDIVSSYTEIIGDELNHISRFMELFITLSQIQIKGV